MIYWVSCSAHNFTIYYVVLCNMLHSNVDRFKRTTLKLGESLVVFFELTSFMKKEINSFQVVRSLANTYLSRVLNYIQVWSIMAIFDRHFESSNILQIYITILLCFCSYWEMINLIISCLDSDSFNFALFLFKLGAQEQIL